MHPLYTCGYGQIKSTQHLLKWVREHNAMLLDIRFSPRSRNPVWAGGNLKKLLDDRYIHVKALGNKNYKTGGPVELVDPEAGLASVQISLWSGPVVLMCACKDVHTCHRKDAAEYIADKTGVQVIHLSAKDFEQPAGGAEPPTQLRLF